MYRPRNRSIGFTTIHLPVTSLLVRNLSVRAEGWGPNGEGKIWPPPPFWRGAEPRGTTVLPTHSRMEHPTNTSVSLASYLDLTSPKSSSHMLHQATNYGDYRGLPSLPRESEGTRTPIRLQGSLRTRRGGETGPTKDTESKKTTPKPQKEGRTTGRKVT